MNEKWPRVVTNRGAVENDIADLQWGARVRVCGWYGDVGVCVYVCVCVYGFGCVWVMEIDHGV